MSNLLSPRRAKRPAVFIALIVMAGAMSLVSSSPAGALNETRPLTLDNSQFELGRLFRDGSPSVCGTAKAFPGTSTPASTFNYTTSPWVATATGCLTVSRVSADCGDGGLTNSTNAHVSFYNSPYDPAHPVVNYLADQGNSTNVDPLAVNVVAGQSYAIVVTNTGSQASCSVAVKLTIAPDTRITTAPTRASDRPTFAFLGSSDAVAFQCQIDGGAWTACASPLTVTGVAAGSHSFAVRAVDGVSSVDASPATSTFTRCDLAALSSISKQADKKVGKAQAALKRAKQSGHAAAITAAKKKLGKAKKAAKKAKAAAKACAS